ncbi:MAG: HEAT repeat domain-containing protein [Proteobacteria bacterium]|nr:HEAT repeat domain-containing protein [Pseudomonadota bacterium]
MEQNEKDFLEELKYCVGKKDIVKACALLQFFSEISAKSQGKVLFEILKASDKVAYPMLERLSRTEVNDPLIKEKITELIYEKSYHNSALIVKYIRGRDRENKGLYIRIAGDLKLKDALYALEDILLKEKDENLLEASITAIGKIGDPSASTTVAKFLHVDTTRLQLAAVYALAEMGGASAIKKLCESLTGDINIGLVIVDALAQIQDHLALEKLTELLSSQFVDLRNAAIDRLIELGPKAIPFVAENLKSDDADTIIHSLNVLGNIGDITALPAILKVIYSEPENANVRFAIYEAMERLPSSKSAISLAQGLTDPVGSVSMAAAKAIDKNLSTVLVAGLKNIVEAGDKQSEQVVATLIDSGADNAFNFLLESKLFQEYAFNHLIDKAHPDTVSHFLSILKKKGDKALGKRIKAAIKPAETYKIRIMAVDDSKMMLKIYMRKLHGMGFESETHEFPVQALSALRSSKPDLVITDLNMPEINGIQLSEEIRKLYSSKELPIIMITTQSDIAGQSVSSDKGTTENIVKKVGINLVLNKPFEDKDLRGAINTLLHIQA